MSDNIQNFNLHAGDNPSIPVTVKDSADVVVDITAATAIKWNLYRDSRGTALVTKTLGSGITVTSGVGGIFTIALVAGDTSALFGYFYHEAELTLGGNISTVLTGYIQIRRGAA